MHALAHHCGSLPKHHRVDWGLLFYLTSWCENKQSTLRKKVVLTKVTCISRALSKGQTNFPSLCCHSAFMLLIFLDFIYSFNIYVQPIMGQSKCNFFFRVILKFKKLQSQQIKIFWEATKERNLCKFWIQLWNHYLINKVFF